jgi:hypothetical protein
MLVQSELLGIFNNLLGQKAKLRKGGVQATYHCPFCLDRNLVTKKLEIALGGPRVGSYHCWRCNTKGKSFGTLLKKLNASSTVRGEVFKLTGDIRLSRNSQPEEDYPCVQLPSEFHPISQPKKTPEYKNALAYLKRRGILREDILRYNIGYCEEGEYEQHIIVPSYDATGTLNFFIGRRYYDTPGAIPHKKPEVSMDLVGFESFVNYHEPINLCEGVFDAMAIRNNAVPLFGKYPSKKLREAMVLHGTKRVNMILDNDALEDAIRNCEMMMRLGIEVHLVYLHGKDPATLGFKKTHQLIRGAEPFTEDDLLRHELQL